MKEWHLIIAQEISKFSRFKLFKITQTTNFSELFLTDNFIYCFYILEAEKWAFLTKLGVNDLDDELPVDQVFKQVGRLPVT